MQTRQSQHAGHAASLRFSTALPAPLPTEAMRAISTAALPLFSTMQILSSRVDKSTYAKNRMPHHLNSSPLITYWQASRLSRITQSTNKFYTKAHI
jgi:hypothetical protein